MSTPALSSAELTPETDALVKEHATAEDYIRIVEHAKDLERRLRRVFHYWGQEKECSKVLRDERDEAIKRHPGNKEKA